MVVGLVLGALVIAIPIITWVRAHSRELRLAEHGVVATGTVVGRERGSGPWYLDVRIDQCACTVAVPTTAVARHPEGTRLAVRYDPEDPQVAEAMVDAFSPYRPLYSLVGYEGVAGVMTGGVLLARWRRRRRARNLTRTSAPTAQVRVEAWEQVQRNKTWPFLSLYPAGSPPGSPALLVVAVRKADLALHPEDATFDLYGGGRPGVPLALQSGGVTITPSARSHAGTWEARRRTRFSAVQPAADATESGDPVPFSDASEAAAYWRWRRSTFLALFAIPLTVPLLGLPQRDSWVAATSFATLLALFFVSAVRLQLLVGRLARRLPGKPTTRFERRAANVVLGRLLSGPAGRAQLARLLGTVPERLAAQDRTGKHLVFGAMAVGAISLLLLLAFGPG